VTDRDAFFAKKQRDGSDRQLAFPANAETRMMTQRVILAEHEKVVAEATEKPTQNSIQSLFIFFSSRVAAD